MIVCLLLGSHIDLKVVQKGHHQDIFVKAKLAVLSKVLICEKLQNGFNICKLCNFNGIVCWVGLVIQYR